MPVYAYRCKNCGYQFEEHQSFEDEPLTHCPECEQEALRKLIQPVGIVFKGSGFYVTDNRGKTHGRDGRTSLSSDNGKQGDGSESGESKADGSDASPAKDAKDNGKQAPEKKTENKTASDD